MYLDLISLTKTAWSRVCGGQQVAFRLAPTYALYLMARYRASTHFRPELNPLERAQRLTLTLSRVGAMMQAVVQER